MTPLLESPREANPEDSDDQTASAALESEDRFVSQMSKLYFRIPWTRCPDCLREWNCLHPSGVCITCVDEALAKERKQAELGVYLRKTIGVYGIERYSFENFIKDDGNEDAFNAMRDFDPLRENIFLHGSSGVGKTHLAGACLKRACGNNASVAWLQPLYVGRVLRSIFPSAEEEIIESWVSKDVCIVDDLGVGRDLDVTLRMIYELLDKRRARKRNGLIIASNHSLDTLAKAYKDDRIVSRIAGMCRIIQIQGADRRLEERISP